MTDWRSGLEALDASLLNEYQRGLPVTAHPFQAVAETLGTTESDVLDRVRALVENGVVRRVGPVLNPPVIGSSTLAAMAVPSGKMDEVAGLVNAHDQVNHNYERAHELNLWFVVTAPDRPSRTAILDRIREQTGLDVLALPMLTEYDIDLTFPVVNEDRVARDGRRRQSDGIEPTHVDETVPSLSRFERRVVLAVQDGLPLVTTPYRAVADALDAIAADVIDALRRLRSLRAIKRNGCVLDHHAVGFTSNCMVVWAVPPEKIDERGVRAAEHPSVTYCCRRRRRPEQDWPYTLFTMIHGRNRTAVDDVIDELATGTLPVEFERLHTESVRKQTGVTYRDLLADDGPAPSATTATGGQLQGVSDG